MNLLRVFEFSLVLITLIIATCHYLGLVQFRLLEEKCLLSRTFHSFLYHATRSENCLLCNNDSLTTINSFLQKHSEANYRCFCCLLQQNEEINQSACDLAKGVAQEGGVFSAGSICQTARLYAQGAGKERIQKRFEAQIAIFLKNDLDLLIAEVSKKQCR